MADEDRVGFELDGEFLPVEFNADHGKDLMLLDRIAAMGVEEFLDAIASGSTRAPVMLTMLATSIRAKHPDWSVDRIYRMVTDDLTDLAFVGGADQSPPDGASGEATPTPNGPEGSASDGSSPSSIPPGPGTEQPTSEPLYAHPA